jgi:hypothetical protein
MTAAKGKVLRLLAAALIGAAMFAAGPLLLGEPLGIALWAVVTTIILLPLALHASVARVFLPVSGEAEVASPGNGLCNDRLCDWTYALAAAAVVSGTLAFAGALPAIVVAAVAWSLIGSAQLLSTLRMPVAAAIAVTVVAALLSFAWPIWAADLLARHDIGPWLQRLVNISPSFALNAAVAPDDPLTHRPMGYRLMNLGQDVNYAMPTSVWPCVLLHAAVGLLGMIGRGWTRMNADKKDRPEERPRSS